MRAKSVILFLALLYLFPLSVSADDALTPLEKSSLAGLGWQECVREAKQNHPDLVSAEEELNQAKANKAIAISGLLPQISGSLSEKTSKTATKDKTDTYSYSITGKQLLFDGLKTPHNVASAVKDVKSAQYSYEVTSSNIRLKLRTAFVELLKAQELLQITKRTP